MPAAPPLSERPAPRLKAALTVFPDRYALPPRPASGPPSALDAHRQTSFLMGGDLTVFEQAMNLQLRIVAANAKLRGEKAAALFSLWSRAYSALADTCALMSGGSYASCPPLLRTACDCIATQRSLIAGGFAEYEEWFPAAVRQAKEHAALGIDLGRFRAASVLSEDERLGGAYRLLSDLSMPHFGATLLLTAPDSGLQKLALTFGDTAFHLGWAELITGWLLLLADAQLSAAVSPGVLSVPNDLRPQQESLARDVNSALSSRRRCYVDEAGGRFLFHNFRRAASGAPKRVLL